MRILIVTPTIFALPLKGYGGIEVVAYSLAIGYQKEGHQVAVVAPAGSELPESIELIETELRAGEEKAFETYAHRLPEFDIIHDHTFEAWCYTPGVEPPLPVVHTFHTDPSIWSSAPPVVHPNIVGISRRHSANLAIHLGVPVKTIYNGVDTTFYTLGDEPRNGRYLWMGRYTPEKGCLEAIQMAKRLKIPLDLYGDAEIVASPAYVDRCRNEADGILVRYNPGLSREDTVQAYQTYKALLYTPNWDEPFGLVMAEAALCGMPVVALDRGSVGEVVSDGVSGIVRKTEVDIEAALVQDLVKDISPTDCRQWGESFSVEQMTGQYLNLFNNVLEGETW